MPANFFTLFTAGLACLAPLASAYTKPTGDAPVGNPISEPGLKSIVPAGQDFAVTWKPTTPGTVTLVLLKGPSKNAVPQYAIVEGIKNDGTYMWTPNTDLEPMDTGYGIQLIDDETGQYQYTTQFGISNPDWKPSDASPTSNGPEASDHPSTWGGWASATRNATIMPTARPSQTSWSHSNSTTAAPTSSITTQVFPLPTTSSTINPSGPANATGSAPSSHQTNAASGVTTGIAGLVLAAGVAVFAL